MKKIIIGINDLETTHPDIAKEWHPSLNKGCYPTDFMHGSRKKVWWKCNKDERHVWCSVIYSRKIAGCPFCSNKKLLEGYNDLQTRFSEVAKEWHPILNGKLKPTQVMPGSSRKVWWICEKGHEWQASLYTRTRRGVPTGCPICVNQKIVEGVNDLATTYPELLDEWSYDNNSILPTEVSSSSGTKVWWKCKVDGHLWKATIDNRHKGKGCPVCSSRIIVSGINDLQTNFPEISEEWDYVNNKLNPNSVATKSNKKVWWKCKVCGNTWEAVISSRTGIGCGCPCCNKESRGEKLINIYLKNNNLDFTMQKRFKTCKNSNPLPFDFYIENTNILIEFQGKQHFKSVKFYGGDEDFLVRIKRDKIKVDWCKNNKYDLFILDYKDLHKNQIEKKLKKFLMDKEILV